MNRTEKRDYSITDNSSPCTESTDAGVGAECFASFPFCRAPTFQPDTMMSLHGDTFCLLQRDDTFSSTSCFVYFTSRETYPPFDCMEEDEHRTCTDEAFGAWATRPVLQESSARREQERVCASVGVAQCTRASVWMCAHVCVCVGAWVVSV